MGLTPGSSIGGYRIVSSEGAGGMGEVYRAQDIRLGREVALKVLPPAFADDPERRSRFEREARLLASLNHPNIATVHGLQEVGAHNFLEMELVPGETLTQIFAKAPMTVREALPVFQQIALALEAAHERGIIHRDLKPSNVKVTPDGRVKVLDFGLAKALGESNLEAASAGETTASFSNTGMGVILGTAAYMCPEQARSKPVDRRADIWSFGCVFFEALSGKPPFLADTFSDTLVKVLTDEPDWSALQNVSPTVLRLIQRCLRKDPQSRMRDIADARLEIEEVLGSSELGRSAALPLMAPPPAAAMTSRAMLAGAAAAAVLVGALGGWFVARSTAPPPSASTPVRRLTVPFSSGLHIVRDIASPLAISPDGQVIVYAAAQGAGRTRLYLRRLGTFDTLPIGGTDGASAPFFSPDGAWVGFHAGGAIQKVALAGGAPLRVADTPPLWSASWGADDHLLFATTLPGDGIWRVTAAGGDPVRVTTPDAERKELRHAAPQLLPGGRRVLFSVLGAEGWTAAIGALDSKEVTRLPGRFGGAATLVAGSHLVFAQDGGLVALPFDAAQGTLATTPIPLLDRVATARLGSSYFAVSASGVLVYAPADAEPPARSLVLVDREGRSTRASALAAAYEYPRFSRDGRRLAVTIAAANGGDVWVYDLERDTRTRVTTGGMSRRPIWAADGSRLAFEWRGPAVWSLYAKAADGAGTQQPLIDAPPPLLADGWMDPMAGVLPGSVPSLTGAHVQSPSSWATGGPLAFVEHKPNGERDIWVLPPGESAVPFLITPFDESAPEFSPDGRFLAYVSDESGLPEVYVQPHPGPGGKWLISTGGGTDPVWSSDSRELFYRRGDSVMSVAVRLAPSFQAGPPREIFNMHDETPGDARNYDVSPDGRRFVMVQGSRVVAPEGLSVVLDWLGELSLVPARPVGGR
jgi:eukaryotic-like serine/threonine-protein kinase